VVAPQVFSHSLRINPLVVIFALLLGGHLHGITGALVALPLAAIARETVIYLRRHLLMEPWGTPTAAVLRAQPAGNGTAATAGAPGSAGSRGIAWASGVGRQLRRRWPGRSRRAAEPEHPSGDPGSPPTPPTAQ
jgi:hypothetical protein